MKYVIIGASAAGISAAETIRKLDSTNEVIVVSEDANVYSRCMLHHVISGSRSTENISFVKNDFFEKNAIQWIKNTKVVNIIGNQKSIVFENDTSLQFDRLLIATGAKAFIPPIKGLENAKNAFKFRDISDVNNIIDASNHAKSALVIGAGLVGLDAACGLMERGLKVSIVEIANRVLPLQLDYLAAGNYQKRFEQHGINVYTGVSVDEVITNENNQAQYVKLNDSTEINCDLIIVAAGVRPNLDFVKDSSLKVIRGIVVDDQMRSSVPNVFAAGDVTGTGIWPNAVKQGIVAAYNMVGEEKHLDDFFTLKNSINLLGLETVSVGLIDAPDSTYEVDILDYKGIYKKIIHKNGIVYGVILQKDVARCGFWTHIIKEKININGKDKSIFNLNYADFYGIEKDGSYKYEMHSESCTA